MSVLVSMFIFFCAIWICHPDKFSITSLGFFMTMPLTRSFHVSFTPIEALMITVNICWPSKSNRTLHCNTWVLPCIILWAKGMMTWKCPVQNFDSSAVLFPILLVGLWNWRLWPVLVGIRRFMNIVLIIIRLRCCGRNLEASQVFFKILNLDYVVIGAWTFRRKFRWVAQHIRFG